MNIKEIRDELAQALSRTFEDSRIAIYGAGDTAQRIVVPFLEEIEQNGRMIQCFIDDTPSKQGTFFYGKPVISLAEAQEKCKSLPVLICSAMPRSRKLMERALQEHPIENAQLGIWDEYVFCKHRNEVLAVFDLLEDDLSKASYANIILFRMGKASQDFTLVQRDHQYFALPEFMEDFYFNETFVDCGAFVGDTIEKFLEERGGVFRKIYAFEPSETIFHALSARTDRIRLEWGIPENKIELVQAGIGDGNYRIEDCTPAKEVPEDSRFELLNRAEVESGGIRICSIDEYFAHEPITFLKADIEGFEKQLVDGAVKVICRDKPRMAICLYHSPFDMYRIALTIKKLCPEYRLAVRQHAYTVNETVLYAYC